MDIEYRLASLEDIDEISKLQKKYHIDTIEDEYKKDGFVTTLFTREQFKSLIEKENGISIAVHKGRVIAYAMAGSWEYWSQWPLFQYMIKDLNNTLYKGERLDIKNSYQYGPIAIEMEYRGGEVLINLFEFSRRQMKDKYDYIITFINHINPRSYRAHTKKVGMDLIKNFKFNNNDYYELGYKSDIKVKGSTI